jgi:hypothetical protein
LDFGGGDVDEKLREKFVSALEKAVLVAGSKNYEEGMKSATKLIGWLYDNVQSIQTREDLRSLLDSFPQMSKREEMIYLFLLNNLPQVVRFALKTAAKKAADTIPPMKSGRPPAIAPHRIAEVLDSVAVLYRKGCSLEVAVYRTSQRFCTSERTIERLWARRESITDDELMPEVTMDEAIEYITSGDESGIVSV